VRSHDRGVPVTPLARFHDRGVTTASDGGRLGDVSWWISDLVAAAGAAGYCEVTYSEVTAFLERRRMPQPLDAYAYR
jgi:hypothetical protein